MTDEELEAIEKWCADMLAAYEQGGQMFANEVCAYIDALPTHSVRSTMLTLVADARATRSALRQLLDAAGHGPMSQRFFDALEAARALDADTPTQSAAK